MKDNKRVYMINFKNKESYPLVNSICDYGWNNLSAIKSIGGGFSLFEMSYSYLETSKLSRLDFKRDY